MTYTVVLLKEPDGRYGVLVPALPGCFTWGHDVPEALEMAREAIEGFLECLADDGEAPPPDVRTVRFRWGGGSGALVYRVKVEEPAAVA